MFAIMVLIMNHNLEFMKKQIRFKLGDIHITNFNISILVEFRKSFVTIDFRLLELWSPTGANQVETSQLCRWNSAQ
jgi:hypothetical protein